MNIDIANRALAEVPEDPIVSIDEDSLAARECRRQYDAVVQEMLEKADLEFARVRAPLAAVTNDRPSFWNYAYALPTDCVSPLRLIPNFATTNQELYRTLYGVDGTMTAMPNWPLLYDGQYEIASGIFYTMEDAAMLEYTSSDAGLFPPLFQQAVVKMLASRIVLPITKSVERKRALEQEAAYAMDTAFAANINRNQPEYVARGANTRQAARNGWWSAPWG